MWLGLTGFRLWLAGLVYERWDVCALRRDCKQDGVYFKQGREGQTERQGEMKVTRQYIDVESFLKPDDGIRLS